MAGQQVAHVFGPNMPTRIAGTAQLMMEPGEVAPSLPWYQPLVPFYPPNISSGGGSSSSTTADGHKLWQRTPSRCDLLFYQGDDVIIPMFFDDPTIIGDDMSSHTWVSQIRVLHRVQSALVTEFVTSAAYQPAVNEVPEHTRVELFLPRSANRWYGQYRWDLYSISDADLSWFPKPDDVDDADWPPTDALRTWLYGIATICPRVTETDDLLGGNSESALIPYPGPPPTVTVITTGGWVVGPNGRVP